MTAEEREKKATARIVREFYLYPNLEQGESQFHLAVLLASWLFGILAPELSGAQISGDTYLIFMLSLLVDFYYTRRTFPCAVIIHGVFRFVLYIFAFESAVLMCIPVGVKGLEELYKSISESLKVGGRIPVGVMLLNLLVVSIGVHKLIYDEETETRREEEERQRTVKEKKAAEEADRVEAFARGVNGPDKGGSTQ